MITFYMNFIPSPPQFFTAFERKALEHIGFLGFIIIYQKYVSIIYCWSSMTFPKINFPENFHFFVSKIVNQGNFFCIDIIEIQTSKTFPFSCKIRFFVRKFLKIFTNINYFKGCRIFIRPVILPGNTCCKIFNRIVNKPKRK